MSHGAQQGSVFAALLTVWIVIDRLRQLRNRRQRGPAAGK